MWLRSTGAVALASISLFMLAGAAITQPPPPAPLAGIAHVAIRVADLNASRAFYQKLGFEEAFAFDKNGVTTQSFVKINDRQFIELYPRAQPTDQAGFMHVCFESADIAALHDFYLARGLAPIPVRKAAAGNLLFTLEGPENQNIEYTQYMPGSRHSSDTGKHLGVTRISRLLIANAIEMRDPVAANTFYIDRLGFSPGDLPVAIVGGSLKSGLASRPGVWLNLPGAGDDQSIGFLPLGSGSTFHMIFAVDNLQQAASQLGSANIPFTRTRDQISIHDPDGNTLDFLVSVRALLRIP